MPCDCGTEPANCVLAGIIIGVILLIFLSSYGYVKVPQPLERCESKPAERCESKPVENLNTRPDISAMKQFRGDAPPPVVMGDPFVLSMQTGSSGVSPY